MYLPSTLSFCLSYLSFLHCYFVFCQLPHPHSQRGSSESQIIMRKPCCDKEGTNKGAWSREEDQKLIDYIRDHGEGRWRFLPKAAGLHRCGKSCRLRWINYLRPDIKRGNFAPDEEDLIIKLHALLGNRWSLIAGRLPGRTDNEVKNYWNSHIHRKLISMGIDPNNHKPHQRFPVPHAHHHVSAASAPSSGSMNKEHRVPFIKSSGVAANDRISATQSCCLVEETGMLSSSSHLSLDLTIAVPSPRQLALVEVKPKPTSHEFTNTRNMDNESAPTLLLFQ